MSQLTPIEIERHEFKTVWRGYDPTEVRAFLGQIANQLTTLTRTQERVAEELEIKAQRLRQVDDYEARLRDALLAATQLAEQTRDEAQRGAEIVIREAELRADQLLQEGREAQRGLVHEIEALRRQRSRLSIELRAVIESHLRVLENHEGDLKTERSSQEQERSDWSVWDDSQSHHRAHQSDQAISEARELTLALSSDLSSSLKDESHEEAVSSSEIDSQLPSLNPTLPQPLTTRPLTEPRELRPAQLSPKSGVAKLQQILSATPRNPKNAQALNRPSSTSDSSLDHED